MYKIASSNLMISIKHIVFVAFMSIINPTQSLSTLEFIHQNSNYTILSNLIKLVNITDKPYILIAPTNKAFTRNIQSVLFKVLPIDRFIQKATVSAINSESLVTHSIKDDLTRVMIQAVLSYHMIYDTRIHPDNLDGSITSGISPFLLEFEKSSNGTRLQVNGNQIKRIYESGKNVVYSVNRYHIVILFWFIHPKVCWIHCMFWWRFFDEYDWFEFMH